MFNNLLKKVIVCPNCGQRSRVPIKPGKVLRVTCPSCANIFEIKFDMPGNNINANSFSLPNIQKQLRQFKTLPMQQKISYILIGISIFFVLRSCIQPAPQVNQKQWQPNQAPQQYQQEQSIINL